MYQQISRLNALVRVLLPGSLTAVAHFLLVHARVFPATPTPSAIHPAGRPAETPAEVPTGSEAALRQWAPVMWVTTAGVTAAVIWEFYERGFEQINAAGRTVGYTNTIVDLLASLIRSLIAGALVLWWGQRHPANPTTPYPTTHRANPSRPRRSRLGALHVPPGNAGASQLSRISVISLNGSRCSIRSCTLRPRPTNAHGRARPRLGARRAAGATALSRPRRQQSEQDKRGDGLSACGADQPAFVVGLPRAGPGSAGLRYVAPMSASAHCPV